VPVPSSAANTPGNGNNINQAQSQSQTGGNMGGLPAGVLIGIVVAAAVVLLCCIANFIPIIIGRRQGKNPAQTHTVVGAAYRATRAAFNRGNDGHTRVYR
jgi:predicted lipid-binding transport protein (Tim44 family)